MTAGRPEWDVRTERCPRKERRRVDEMTPPITLAELEAYLDEALPPDRMTRVEEAIRERPEMLRQLTEINARRDAGNHSVGDIWRRFRLTCPSREQWGSFLLGILPPDEERYLDFHLHEIGCRFCQANLADLQNQQTEQREAAESRRRRYFQSSAGYLHPPE